MNYHHPLTRFSTRIFHHPGYHLNHNNHLIIIKNDHDNQLIPYSCLDASFSWVKDFVYFQCNQLNQLEIDYLNKLLFMIIVQLLIL